MKYMSKLILSAAVVVTLFAACDKVGDLPVYQGGIATVLASSVNSIAPAPADSLSDVVVFSWSDPKYATTKETVKYIVQIDEAGNNFAAPSSKVVSGVQEASFTGKEINAILLGKGYLFGESHDMDVRVVSSYANNNDQLLSNVLTIPMTAYKIPPKIALPASGTLFLVGDASEGGWTNPVDATIEQFVQTDETTFEGVFNLAANKEYLVLPVNGSWDHKYAVANKALPNLSTGGDFGYDLSDNFPGPGTAGQYLIKLDFQLGKFSVTPYTGSLPNSLFLVGDATQGGWTNPVPVPSQQFTRINSSVYEITTQLNGGKEYLMLPVNGSWDHKYAVADKTLPDLSAGGDFGYDKSDNFPAPTAGGNYKIQANFATNKFTVTAQ